VLHESCRNSVRGQRPTMTQLLVPKGIKDFPRAGCFTFSTVAQTVRGKQGMTDRRRRTDKGRPEAVGHRLQGGSGSQTRRMASGGPACSIDTPVAQIARAGGPATPRRGAQDRPALSICQVGRSVLRPHGVGTAAAWMQKNRTSLRPAEGVLPQPFSMVSLTYLAGTAAKLTIVFAV